MPAPISPEHRTDPPAPGRRWWRNRATAIALSLAAHLAILVALLFAQAPTPPPSPPDITPVVVALMAPDRPVDLDKPLDAPAAKPSRAPPQPKRDFVRPTPVRRSDVRPLPAAPGPTHETMTELSEAELAGAATAGSGEGGGAGGSGGRGCDMIRRIQGALRRDPLVQAAADGVRQTGAGRKAIMVWNGDWVRNQAEDGKGLAAVREAIMWEVGFAPEACRAQPVRGLVMISLNDAPGSARLVLGSGVWRWTDLLTPRG